MIEDSFNIIIRKLIFFNLLFFSTIFTIIILVVPSNQDISKKPQSLIVHEDVGDFMPLFEGKDNKNTKLPTNMEKGIKEEKNFTVDMPKKDSESSRERKSESEFQKLIINLFKNQNKK